SKRDWSSDVCSSDLCYEYDFGAGARIEREIVFGIHLLAFERQRLEVRGVIAAIGGDGHLSRDAAILDFFQRQFEVAGAGAIPGARIRAHVLLTLRRLSHLASQSRLDAEEHEHHEPQELSVAHVSILRPQ